MSQFVRSVVPVVFNELEVCWRRACLNSMAFYSRKVQRWLRRLTSFHPRHIFSTADLESSGIGNKRRAATSALMVLVICIIATKVIYWRREYELYYSRLISEGSPLPFMFRWLWIKCGILLCPHTSALRSISSLALFPFCVLQAKQTKRSSDADELDWDTDELTLTMGSIAVLFLRHVCKSQQVIHPTVPYNPRFNYYVLV